MQIIWHEKSIKYMTKNIQTVINKLSFNKMLRRLNHVMLDCVRNSGRDIRLMKFSTSANFLNIIKENRVYQIVHESETLVNEWRYLSSELLIESDEAL